MPDTDYSDQEYELAMALYKKHCEALATHGITYPTWKHLKKSYRLAWLHVARYTKENPS